MKVTLDLTELLENGDISQEEHDRLARLSKTGASSLALNIIIAFGVISVAAGILALVPSPFVGIALGSALTHPNITTDFSEAQLELITRVHADPDDAIGELTDVHRYVYQNLEVAVQ